ncbi:DoxX family protein [Paractinoplanes toevensis]|uniref:DoxX family protein n=1 Tax=Paractinoplanes toevensis TaxID=571911 RepID=A0A919TFE7_9ACTN|nr:DoxX family protein [Actinoplanes toevensis]GIM93026.1 hypothetical protein Ato02nite_048190 [Actinoplanes toevensis]
MNVFLWILAGLLAVVMLASGVQKLIRSKADLAASGQGWVDDFPEGAVKAIGAVEVLAAIGLIAPALFDIAPVLVPLAASGVVLVMVGAVITHARRREWTNIIVNVVLLAIALTIAVLRFGPQSF